MRMKWMLGFVTGGVVLALACSESSTTDNNSSSGGTSSGGASGNNASGGTSGSSGQSTAFKDCSQAQSAGTCTQAELKPYADCVQTNCESAYVECFGPGYKNGSLSGPCSEYIRCTQKCDCNDNACIFECAKSMSQECQTCTPKLTSCTQSCANSIPECAKRPVNVDAGTKTCADLKACCDKMQAGPMKDMCNNLHQNAGNNDATCNSYYAGFQMHCP